MSLAPAADPAPDAPIVRPALTVGLAAGLVVLGLFLVASGADTPAARRWGRAPDHYVLRQALSSLLGAFGLLVAIRLGAARVRRWAGPALLVFGLLSLLTIVPGVGLATGGARRAISIFGLGFQPTILALAFLPVALAHALGGSEQRAALSPPEGSPSPSPGPGRGPVRQGAGGLRAVNRDCSLRRPWLVALVVAVGGVVCLEQPNFGHLGVLLATVLGVLAGLGRPARRMLLGTGLAGLATGPIALCFPYVRWRVASFFDPGLTRDTQALQQILAHLTPLGMGLDHGWEKVRLSAAPTDYLYAMTLEELGLLGGVALVALLLGLVAASAGLSRGEGSAARGVAWGTAAFIGFPALTHVLVNLRLAPVTGIHLPLVSYSGSANVAILIALGLGLSATRTPQPPSPPRAGEGTGATTQVTAASCAS